MNEITALRKILTDLENADQIADAIYELSCSHYGIYHELYEKLNDVIQEVSTELTTKLATLEAKVTL
jgi:hypothetical protein